MTKLTGGESIGPDGQTVVAAGIKPVGEVATMVDKTPHARTASSEQATVVTGAADSASLPTVITTPTSKRAPVKAKPGDEETIAATKLIKDKEAPTRPAKKVVKKSKIGLVYGFLAVAAIAVITVVVILPAIKDKPVEGPTPTPKTIVTAGNGLVRLNIIPWAEIESIVDSNNIQYRISSSVAPCEFQLPEGIYTITVSNSNLSKKKELKVDVREGQVEPVIFDLSDMDSETLMKELGIE